jgi:leader peptidase (prepilin peptidase)/N-methyltransferase
MDLIPLISYIWLRGRCRYCKAPISVRLPVVELATGLLFLYIAAKYGVTLQTPVLLTFVAALVVVFAIDMEHSLIPNKVTYPGTVIAFLVAPWGPVGDGLPVWAAYQEAGWGLLIGGGVLGAVYLLAQLVAHGGFGLGDVKLGLMLGAMLGPASMFVTLQLSFIVGGVVAVALLGFRLRGRRDLIPFGPFLGSAGVVSLFWGGSIFTWYQGLFLP